MDNSPYDAVRYAESICHTYLGFIESVLSYPKNLRICKFRRTVTFSSCVSPLKETIANIVSSSPEKQMARIYARWHITFMKNTKTFLYSSVMKFPRKPMRPLLPSVNPNRPIAIFIGSGFPQPTIGRFLYGIKESFFWRYSLMTICARVATRMLFKPRWSTAINTVRLFFGRIFSHREPPVPCANPRTEITVAGFLNYITAKESTAWGVEYGDLPDMQF